MFKIEIILSLAYADKHLHYINKHLFLYRYTRPN